MPIVEVYGPLTTEQRDSSVVERLEIRLVTCHERGSMDLYNESQYRAQTDDAIRNPSVHRRYEFTGDHSTFEGQNRSTE